jgi:transposase-like protein
MSKRQRRRYSPEEKAKILRLHLLQQVPISEICEKHGIHPTMFYQWQKALFENAAAALEGRHGAAECDPAKRGHGRDVALDNLMPAHRPSNGVSP